MSAASQARAGKNIGPANVANSLIANKNFIQELKSGNNTLAGIAPPAGQKNSYRALSPIGSLLLPGSSSLWFAFKNDTNAEVTLKVRYSWDTKPPVDLILMSPATKVLVVAAGAIAGVSQLALPLGGSVSPDDSVQVNAVFTAPPATPTGKLWAFYGIQDINNKSTRHTRVELKNTTPVEIFSAPLAGTSPNLGTLGGILSIISGIGSLFVVNYDTLAVSVILQVVDENGAVVTTMPPQAVPAALPGFTGQAAAWTSPVPLLPNGWSLKASLAAPLADSSKSVLILTQFTESDEAPASPGGGGAY